MSKSMLVRIAASSLVLAVAIGGYSAQADSARVVATKADREAVKAAARAEKSLAKQDVADAIASAEEAVANAPRDADYRALLGKAYLASGRFQSAATSFSDALALDQTLASPALNLALAEIALGEKNAAKATLDEHASIVPAVDRGLALALAGDAPAGVTILEQAVRGGGSNAKARQNLALAYALAGRWAEAKLMASYDLPPELLSQRMLDWSRFAREEQGPAQVASLLGVKPAEDPGQPVRLALNVAPTPAPVAVAEAAPPPPQKVAETPEFKAVALAETQSSPPEAIAPARLAAFSGVTFGPHREIVQPLPQPHYQPKVADAPLIRAANFAPKVRIQPLDKPHFERAAFVKPAGGDFVVQLGAFSSADRVETAWTRTLDRIGGLKDFSPSTATFRTASATYYRLSIGGFPTHEAAANACVRVKAAGGQCFVREQAGDAPLQWAARGGTTRVAAR